MRFGVRLDPPFLPITAPSRPKQVSATVRDVSVGIRDVFFPQHIVLAPHGSGRRLRRRPLRQPLEVAGGLEQPRPYVLFGFLPSQKFSERVLFCSFHIAHGKTDRVFG
jgi:hypothetical protein